MPGRLVQTRLSSEFLSSTVSTRLGKPYLGSASSHLTARGNTHRGVSITKDSQQMVFFAMVVEAMGSQPVYVHFRYCPSVADTYISRDVIYLPYSDPRGLLTGAVSSGVQSAFS